MADLNDDAATWQEGVYQLEATDPVLGGAPNEATGAGMDNIPHLHLARRTRWLKARVDELMAGMAGAASTAVAGIVQLVDSVTSTATDRAATPNSVRLANENANSRVPQTRTVNTAGLATGGGALSANRTITVPPASEADGIAGTRADVAMTPVSTKAAIDNRVGQLEIPPSVPPTRTVQGGGLASGGGNLTTDRVITVTAATGPEAIAGTRNDVALTPAGGKAALDARFAAEAAHSDYAIGSLVFALRVSGGTVSYGQSVAGTTLRIAGLEPVNKPFMDAVGGTGATTPGLTLAAAPAGATGLPGTWVCLGYAPPTAVPGLSAGPTLYRRVS